MPGKSFALNTSTTSDVVSAMHSVDVPGVEVNSGVMRKRLKKRRYRPGVRQERSGKRKKAEWLEGAGELEVVGEDVAVEVG
jgi:hypothetical protein